MGKEEDGRRRRGLREWWWWWWNHYRQQRERREQERTREREKGMQEREKSKNLPGMMKQKIRTIKPAKKRKRGRVSKLKVCSVCLGRGMRGGYLYRWSSGEIGNSINGVWTKIKTH